MERILIGAAITIESLGPAYAALTKLGARIITPELIEEGNTIGAGDLTGAIFLGAPAKKRARPQKRKAGARPAQRGVHPKTSARLFVLDQFRRAKRLTRPKLVTLGGRRGFSSASIDTSLAQLIGSKNIKRTGKAAYTRLGSAKAANQNQPPQARRAAARG